VIPPGAPKRPLVVNYRGTPYRQRHAQHDLRDEKRGYFQTGNFIDLTIYGKRKGWLPVPVWADEIAAFRHHHGGDEFLVAQAVTKPSRFPIKKTHRVRDALKGLGGVRFEIITKMSNRECLERMGRADLVVTAFKNGFGNAGLEAMSMGIPIIAGGSFALMGAYMARLGELPFARATVEDVRGVVARLKVNDKERELLASKGREYIAKHHAPDVVGERAVLYCQLAKDRQQKRVRRWSSPKKQEPKPASEPAPESVKEAPTPRLAPESPPVVRALSERAAPAKRRPHALLDRRKPEK